MRSEKNAVFLLLKWVGEKEEEGDKSHAVKVKFAGTRTRPGKKKASIVFSSGRRREGVGRNLLRF